jgi:RNA polymerase sigma factor (sigma-70 family)
MKNFDSIVEEHSGYLVRIAYLYVKNWETAEDIVQEVFVKFFQTYEQFRQEASLKTYLTRMTTNRSKDYLRSWKHKKDVLFETIFAQSEGVDETLQQQEQYMQLSEKLFDLPLKYREPLILYYYDEQSIPEIANYLQLNENTVKTRLRRAKQKMREFLQEDEMEVTYDEL